MILKMFIKMILKMFLKMILKMTQLKIGSYFGTLVRRANSRAAAGRRSDLGSNHLVQIVATTICCNDD
jgi:hypothetical protein